MEIRLHTFSNFALQAGAWGAEPVLMGGTEKNFCYCLESNLGRPSRSHLLRRPEL
jgi:hypothetical protein